MKRKILAGLKWSEKFTRTDMVYIASGTFWGNLNGAVAMTAAFVASIIFANFLTKEDYGTYQFILSIASLIGATTLLGMNSAVTQAVARGYEGEMKQSVKYQLRASIVPVILGLSVSCWYFFHNNNHLAATFAWIALFLPLSSTFNTWAAYLGGKKVFRIGSYYGMGNTLVTSGATLLAAYFTQNFIWIIFISFFASFVSNFVIYHLILRQIPPNDKVDGETMKYGTHLSFMSVLTTCTSQLDSLLIFYFIGPAALAVYSFATLLPERLTGILKFIPNLALPKLSEKNEYQVKDLLVKRFWMLLVLIGVLTLGYSILAPWIFNTFFPKYSESILFSQVYSLSFFSIAATFLQTVLTSQRKTKELYTLNIVMPLFRILLMSLLMYYYSIWGLLWAQIIANFVSLTLQLILLFKKPLNTQTT